MAWPKEPPILPWDAATATDMAEPLDMSGFTVGEPTIHCTSDRLPDGGFPSSEAIYTPEVTPDFVALCDGWVVIADENGQQLAFFNPLTHQTAPPIPLIAKPGRLAFDGEHDTLYVALHPIAKIAKVDLVTRAVRYIDGVEAAMLAVGNDGIVLGVSPTDMGTPQLDVFDGPSETLVARRPLTGTKDGTLIAYDRTRKLVVTGATGETSASPWLSTMNRFSFEPSTYAVQLVESVDDIAINGKDLVLSHDATHLLFPCGKGNDGHYNLYDFHTDDFSQWWGVWPIGAYPVAVAYSPDDKLLVASDTSSLQVWDVTTQTKRTEAPTCYFIGTNYDRVAFSRGGKIAFDLTGGCYKVNDVNVGVLTYQIVP